MSAATRLNPEKNNKTNKQKTKNEQQQKEKTLKAQLYYNDISVLSLTDWKGQNVIILHLTYCPFFIFKQTPLVFKNYHYVQNSEMLIIR